jgi:hypothetical protein
MKPDSAVTGSSVLEVVADSIWVIEQQLAEAWRFAIPGT